MKGVEERIPFSAVITPTPAFPEGVKKSILHPHPVPPPSRGREFLFGFRYFFPLPLRERGG
jgi:hypothetical protein